MLKKLMLKHIYNSSDNDIAQEFIVPALKESVLYRRGVGYFTSGWITYNAKGLASLIERGGKIQFITSPILDKNDIQSLSGKYDQETIDRVLDGNIDTLVKYLEVETKNLLGWLVHDGLLEFKFAIPKNILEGGEFHDKFGVFVDEENEYISFNGSMNDSIKGHYNYESISVFTSWGDETSKLQAIELLRRFEKLWNGNDENIQIYSMSDIIKEKLIKIKDSERPYSLQRNSDYRMNINGAPKLPEWLTLRDYQKNAINAWIKNNGSGIWEMATGSGKTITALSAVTHLLNSLPRYVPFVVVVPYLHLVEQWGEEGKNFNIDFIKCGSDYNAWDKALNHAITISMHDEKRLLPILTTVGTYRTDRFQNLIKKLNNIILVVDEVHNFGAKDIRNKYLDNIRFKLGLSATPKRHMDEEGSQAIIDYFGDIIFTYTLKDAINDGNLTPYYYYPIFVKLTPDEESQYLELTEKIGKMISMGEDFDNPGSGLKLLLIRRSRIIANAVNKIVKLKNLIIENDLVHTKHNLFYTAAKIEKQSDGTELRMVDKIVTILRELGMQVEKFTAEESKYERKFLIEGLADGLIDGLVAIRCLDEGVDIPSVERAFILASSSNPKEFIQRRGRVLRKSKETGKKFAYIYDFLVLPDFNRYSDEMEMYEYERSYIEKELRRFQEFAKLAENAYEAEKEIMDIKQFYNLIHI